MKKLVIKICPACGKRYSVQPHSGDYIHNCNDFPISPTLAKEDVVVVQTKAVDFDGTHTRGPAAVMRAGLANKLQGTRAGTDGQRLGDVTNRGHNSSTHRSRSRYTYIEDADKIPEPEDLTEIY